jgi:hypothetical protein
VDVLAAADAVAHGSRPAHDLGEESLRIVEPREVVAVTPVVAQHVVVRFEQTAHGDGHVLLAEAGVRGPGQLAAREQVEQRRLEVPDEQHRGPVGDRPVRGCPVGRCPVGGCLVGGFSGRRRHARLR